MTSNPAAIVETDPWEDLPQVLDQESWTTLKKLNFKELNRKLTFTRFFLFGF